MHPAFLFQCSSVDFAGYKSALVTFLPRLYNKSRCNFLILPCVYQQLTLRRLRQPYQWASSSFAQDTLTAYKSNKTKLSQENDSNHYCPQIKLLRYLILVKLLKT